MQAKGAVHDTPHLWRMGKDKLADPYCLVAGRPILISEHPEADAEAASDPQPSQSPRKRPYLHESSARVRPAPPQQAPQGSSSVPHAPGPFQGHHAAQLALHCRDVEAKKRSTAGGRPAILSCSPQDLEHSMQPQQEDMGASELAVDACHPHRGLHVAKAHQDPLDRSHHPPSGAAQAANDQPFACHSHDPVIATNCSRLQDAEHTLHSGLGGPVKPLPPEGTRHSPYRSGGQW